MSGLKLRERRLLQKVCGRPERSGRPCEKAKNQKTKGKQEDPEGPGAAQPRPQGWPWNLMGHKVEGRSIGNFSHCPPCMLNLWKLVSCRGKFDSGLAEGGIYREVQSSQCFEHDAWWDGRPYVSER